MYAIARYTRIMSHNVVVVTLKWCEYVTTNSCIDRHIVQFYGSP